MADYVLEGQRWGTGVAGSAGGLVTWSVSASLPASFVPVVTAAFADWAANANIAFNEVAGNADITLGEKSIDGLDNILGETDYTYTGQRFDSADIVFDSGENWRQSGSTVVSGDSVNLFLVALHEIGHAIGLDHYNAGPAVMNATLDSSVTDLTTSDLDGVHALYGLPLTAAPTSAPTAPPVLSPSDGNDQLTGTDGPDLVDLLGGDDTYVAEGGNDTVSGNTGADIIYGNTGDDQLFGNTGSDTLYGGQGNDLVHGGKDDDVLFGNRGNDTLYGDLGNDVLHGGKGDDMLFGGQGDDVLLGELGNDTLAGGQGADRFVFGPGGGNDVVQDFSQGDSDKLDIQGQTYAVSAAPDGSALITLSGGGTVDLAGITPDHVNPSFFASATTQA